MTRLVEKESSRLAEQTIVRAYLRLRMSSARLSEANHGTPPSNRLCFFEPTPTPRPLSLLVSPARVFQSMKGAGPGSRPNSIRHFSGQIKLTSEIDVCRVRRNHACLFSTCKKDPQLSRRVHHRIGLVRRCPGMCRFMFVAPFLPHSGRYSGSVGIWRHPGRPGRTAPDFNFRSSVTLPLGTGLQIPEENAGGYLAVRCKEFTKKDSFFKFCRYNGWVFFYHQLFFPSPLPRATATTWNWAHRRTHSQNVSERTPPGGTGLECVQVCE